MARTRSRPKRFSLVRAKRSRGPSAESRKVLVIQRWHIGKRKLHHKWGDPHSGSLVLSLRLCQGDRDPHGGFFATRVEVIEVDPASTPVIGTVNDARRHGTSSYQGAASCLRPKKIGCFRAPTRAKGNREHSHWP
ncbi:hypothetical protein MPNT_400014 [Candidatus Methylacidithermus pantelleriae]|uniref:Uncharacterized protein n=1 Tax=Candidatus Methylacidithermus pantelleriae TaxID=2744239 RepID=A0A8J2FTC1_9BACT|nr:hypothetical protein MPNT_400014 [Candidatus Methylacidithermus pantelleriae]